MYNVRLEPKIRTPRITMIIVVIVARVTTEVTCSRVPQSFAIELAGRRCREVAGGATRQVSSAELLAAFTTVYRSFRCKHRLEQCPMRQGFLVRIIFIWKRNTVCAVKCSFEIYSRLTFSFQLLYIMTMPILTLLHRIQNIIVVPPNTLNLISLCIICVYAKQSFMSNRLNILQKVMLTEKRNYAREMIT